MQLDQFLASVGLGNLVIEDFFLVQVGVLTATIILLIVALIFVSMAFKAARSAQSAQFDSEKQFSAMQGLVSEMKGLQTDIERQREDFEKNTASLFSSLQEPDDIEINTPPSNTDFTNETSDGGTQCDIEECDDTGNSEASLSAARDAASLPSALLRGLLRRKN